jgi:hypothetical protein
MGAPFAYPEQAAFGRVLPKSKIYSHGAPSSRVKGLFVSQVNQIVWRYKLAPETLRLDARPDVPEIEVFEIELRTRELEEDVLRCIDKTIPFPIIYELSHENAVRTVAAFKRPNENDSGKYVVGDYYMSAWHDAGQARQALPVALNLGGLYEQILRSLVSQPARRGETLRDQMDRLASLRRLQSEYRKLEKKLEAEHQFNRKVEINAKMRTMIGDIDQLSAIDEQN